MNELEELMLQRYGAEQLSVYFLLSSFKAIYDGSVKTANDYLSKYLDITKKPIEEIEDLTDDADKIMAMEAKEKAQQKAAKVKAKPKQRYFTDTMLDELQLMLIADQEKGTKDWTVPKLAKHFKVAEATIIRKIHQLKKEGSL